MQQRGKESIVVNSEFEVVAGHPPVAPEPFVGTVLQSASMALDIYVAQHCHNCAYAREVAEEIRQNYPHVQLRVIDIGTTTEPIPEAVFATPTYLLNGRVWSLGNPSPAMIQEAFTLVGVN